MTAPQPVESPTRAMGLPSTRVLPLPVTMGVTPWPGNGHTCISPMRATRMPFAMVRLADEIALVERAVADVATLHRTRPTAATLAEAAPTTPPTAPTEEGPR